MPRRAKRITVGSRLRAVVYDYLSGYAQHKSGCAALGRPKRGWGPENACSCGLEAVNGLALLALVASADEAEAKLDD